MEGGGAREGLLSEAGSSTELREKLESHSGTLSTSLLHL